MNEERTLNAAELEVLRLVPDHELATAQKVLAHPSLHSVRPVLRDLIVRWCFSLASMGISPAYWAGIMQWGIDLLETSGITKMPTGEPDAAPPSTTTEPDTAAHDAPTSAPAGTEEIHGPQA